MDDALTLWMMADRHGLEDTSHDVPDWFAQAACAGHETALWFAVPGRSYAAALAVCDGCEVRDACLDHALDVEADAHARYRFGVWGGTTPNGRARLARQVA